MLVLFLAYSGGVGFSIHNCEHCHEIKIYLFQHPDCCPASETEHHSGKSTEYNYGQASCCHQKQCLNDDLEISPEAYTAHCQQCCVSDYMYFKIQSNYMQSQHAKLFQIDDYANNMFSIDLLWEEGKLPLFGVIDNRTPLKEIPPLLPGGERFIIYSHQLLFYA